jgi:hypothetical protein
MKSRNKYGAKKTFYDGITFDSRGEAMRWADLKLLERAGEIKHLQRQVPYVLTAHGKPICKLIVDFTYMEKGRLVDEDFKSDATTTPVFKLKAKMFAAQYGRSIKITGKGKA